MNSTVFFNEKHCTLIVYITEFSQKIGGPNALLAPQSVLGGHGPPGPPSPVADPMCTVCINVQYYVHLLDVAPPLPTPLLQKLRAHRLSAWAVRKVQTMICQNQKVVIYALHKFPWAHCASHPR